MARPLLIHYVSKQIMDGLHLMKKHLGKYSLIALFGMIALLSASVSHAGQTPQVSFLYQLSTFTGKAEVGAWPRIIVDPVNSEVYVLSDELRVFNQSGMETYTMASSVTDEKAGERPIIDAVVKKNGDIIFLVHVADQGKLTYYCTVADFRGEPLSRIEMKNFPSDLADFIPDRMLSLNGLIYLASSSRLMIVVVNEEGSYQRSYNIMSLLQKQESGEWEGAKNKKSLRKRGMDEVEYEIGDFSTDREGNIFFTLPVVGSAYKLTPDLQLTLISKRGSGPGKFGIPNAIITDAKGNYLVSDILKSVVMVFDKDLNYIGSFGGRNNGQESLIVPRGLVMDENNRLYVSQTDVLGVSVFQFTYD